MTNFQALSNGEPRRQLGKTTMMVSPIAFGAWSITGMGSLDVNDRDSLKTIRAALDQNINFIDTAFCYGANGESERLIGEVLKEIGLARRDELVIASKGGIHCLSETELTNDARPETIIRQCDESLRRLGTDVIDLHYLHRPDPKVGIEESAGAFNELLKQGKIRAVGASNVTLAELQLFHTVCPVSAIQPFYNILQRDIESDLIPWCREHQVSVCCYRPLGKGLLAGKIRRGHVFDPNDKRINHVLFADESFERAQRLLDLLDKIAEQIGKTVTQIVVNWTIHRSGITSALCGAKRDWQIVESAGGTGWQLDESALQAIDEILDLPV